MARAGSSPNQWYCRYLSPPSGQKPFWQGLPIAISSFSRSYRRNCNLQAVSDITQAARRNKMSKSEKPTTNEVILEIDRVVDQLCIEINSLRKYAVGQLEAHRDRPCPNSGYKPAAWQFLTRLERTLESGSKCIGEISGIIRDL